MKKNSLSISWLIFLLAVLINTPAHSASSPWFKTDGARIRLVSMPSADGKSINAGLQIELEKGWKTYWRSPGSSGIPPDLKFTGSKNIASSKLSFPVPVAFGDDDNLSAGYTENVTFPITIKPLFANRAVVLKVTGLLGICGEICLPVDFTLTLEENGKGVSTRDVASALFSSRANLIGARRDDFHIAQTKFIDAPERLLSVAARVPEGTVVSTLYVEGPNTWYLMPTRAKKIENNMAYFDVRLSDIPASAAPLETTLVFSLVADGAGIEQKLVPVK